MKCENCGAKLKRADAFCPECGAQVVKARRSERKAAAPTAAERGRKRLRFPFLIAGAVLAVALGGFLAAKEFGVLSCLFGKSSGEILFVSDGSVYGISLKGSGEKRTEYTDSFYGSEAAAPERIGRLFFPTVSRDGKYRFFPEDFNGQERNFTLCYQEGREKPRRIASDVRGYYVTGDNQVVYVKNDSLYVTRPGEQEEKVDSDLLVTFSSFFYFGFWEARAGYGLAVSKDESKMVWRTDSGCYCQDIDLEEEKVKLVSDGFLLAYTENFESLLFQKDDGALYLSKNLQKAEKVADDADLVLATDLEKGTFYYTVVKAENVKLADYIEDDLAETDRAITEPVKSDYEREVTSGFGTGAYTRRVVDDQYYDDLERWQRKLERDELRQWLKGVEVPVKYEELYFWNNGEETLVTSDYGGRVASADVSISSIRYDYTDLREKSSDFTGVLVYQKFPETEGERKKVKMSELPDYRELEDSVQRAEEEGGVGPLELLGVETVPATAYESEYFLCVDGVEYDLGLKGWSLAQWLFDARSNQLYFSGFRRPGEDGGYYSGIMSVNLADGAGQVREYAEYASLRLVYGGNVYYFQDWNAEDGGDLYRNGEFVCDDVLEVWPVPDSNAVVAVTDYDEDSQSGTLKLLLEKGGEPVEIGADVDLTTFPFGAYGEDCIFMISDYSSERKSGDLRYFDGKKTRVLESDVTAYFSDYAGDDFDLSLMGGNGAGFNRTMNRLNEAKWRGKEEAEEERAYAEPEEAEEAWAWPEEETSDATEAASEEAAAAGW